MDFFKITQTSFRDQKAGFLWCPRATQLFLMAEGYSENEPLDVAINNALQKAIIQEGEHKGKVTVTGLNTFNRLAYACHVAYCEYEDIDPVIKERQQAFILDAVGLEKVLEMIGLDNTEADTQAGREPKKKIRDRIKAPA